MFTLFTLLAFSQEYGTINYMGKEFQITSDFFKKLNEEYRKKDYSYECQQVYYAVVDLLKSDETILYIDEAKRISWNSHVHFPYCDDCKTSKHNRRCAGSIFKYIVIPVVERCTSD